jgi:predicted DNA-binding transcriptional regulator AlpA
MDFFAKPALPEIQEPVDPLIGGKFKMLEQELKKFLVEVMIEALDRVREDKKGTDDEAVLEGKKYRLLSIKDAADTYGFKRQQLYELCRSEQLKHVRFGKSFMIPAYCIEEWIELKAEQTTERREEIIKNGGRFLRY